MAKESVAKSYTTGICEVVGFVNVATPSTKFDKDGAYQLNVLISETEGKALVKKIEEILEEQYKTYRKNNKKMDITACVPYIKIEKDDKGHIIKETPDSEGRYVLKTKNKAYIKDGKITQKIPVFDSKLHPVDVISFGAGSKLKVGITLEGYSSNLGTGVSIKLRAVQILEVCNFGGYKAEDFFGEEEGYEYTAEVVEAPEETDEEDF